MKATTVIAATRHAVIGTNAGRFIVYATDLTGAIIEGSVLLTGSHREAQAAYQKADLTGRRNRYTVEAR